MPAPYVVSVGDVSTSIPNAPTDPHDRLQKDDLVVLAYAIKWSNATMPGGDYMVSVSPDFEASGINSGLTNVSSKTISLYGFKYFWVESDDSKGGTGQTYTVDIDYPWDGTLQSIASVAIAIRGLHPKNYSDSPPWKNDLNKSISFSNSQSLRIPAFTPAEDNIILLAIADGYSGTVAPAGWTQYASEQLFQVYAKSQDNIETVGPTTFSATGGISYAHMWGMQAVQEINKVESVSPKGAAYFQASYSVSGAINSVPPSDHALVIAQTLVTAGITATSPKGGVFLTSGSTILGTAKSVGKPGSTLLSAALAANAELIAKSPKGKGFLRERHPLPGTPRVIVDREEKMASWTILQDGEEIDLNHWSTLFNNTETPLS